MTGLPDFGRQAFNEFEEVLKSGGYDVINPAILPCFLSREKCMPICLAMIDAADEVYALNNWSESLGATVEVNYAKALGKPIMYEHKIKTSKGNILTLWSDLE